MGRQTQGLGQKQVKTDLPSCITLYLLYILDLEKLSVSKGSISVHIRLSVRFGRITDLHELMSRFESAYSEYTQRVLQVDRS